MAGRQIVVQILGDASKFTKATKDATTSAGKFSNVMKGVGMGMGIGITQMAGQAASAVVDFVGDSIKAASNLSETMAKSEVIFGHGADAMEDWAGTAAETMGLSQRAALDAASGFAGLFKTVGIAMDEATDMSTELTALGSDLASFFNTDMASALGALKSGLNGESEPLRAFNVFLSETAVTAKLAEMGIQKVGGKFTEAQKATARYNLILEQTTDAQGDYERTADGLANTQRSLEAEMENLSATLGQELLPYMRDATKGVLDFVRALDELPDPGNWWNEFTEGAQGLVDVLPKTEFQIEKQEKALRKARKEATHTAADWADMASAMQSAMTDTAETSDDTSRDIRKDNRATRRSYAELAEYVLDSYTENFDTAMGIVEARADLHNAKTDEDKAQAYADLAELGALSEKDYARWLATLERLAANTKGKVREAYLAAIADIRQLREIANRPINVTVKYNAKGNVVRNGVEIFAAGGTSRGGMAWVGEQGPELVNLPRGSYVNNAARSKQMAGGSGVTVNVHGNIYGPSGVEELMDMMASRLRLDGV